MSTNLSRYEADLERLIDDAQFLLMSMRYEQNQSGMRELLNNQLGEEAEEFIKKLPRFAVGYQLWYSEAKAVVRLVIPDRLSDFVRHYERRPNRKTLEYDSYTIEDYLQGLESEIVTMSAGIPRMEQQFNILRSAQQRFKKSSLFDIRQLVAADLFDSEIMAARALVKNKFVRAAGAIAGVVLEKHLAQVCENHNINVKRNNPPIGEFNELLKNANVIDTLQWRANQHLAEIRNLCDHNKAREPTEEQVRDLIDGVAKVLKTML